MAASDFFSRWGRSPNPPNDQTPTDAGPAPNVESKGAEAPPPNPLPPPSLDDVAELTPESDYSRFVGKDVDDAVKRSAMKKLFSNPHFNVMDGLDIYIDDYNQFIPLTPAMLASLNHAKDILNPPWLKEQNQHAQKEEQGEMPAPAAVKDAVPSDSDTVEGEGARMEEDGRGSLNQETESSFDLPGTRPEDKNDANQHLSQGGQ